MTYRALGRRVLTVLTLAGALASVAIACGEDAALPPGEAPDASTGDASAPDVTPADGATPAVTELDAFCAGTLGLYAPRYAACCDPTDAPKRYSFDHALLESLLLSCTTSLGESTRSGRAAFDPVSATTCEANVSGAIQARTCPEVLRRPSNQPSESIFDEAPGCAGVIVGRQGAGAPCANDYECLDGLTCLGWTPQSDGVCQAPAGDGAPCGYGIPDGGGFLELVHWGFGAHPRCAAGFYCASTATQQGTCKAAKADGGSCNAHDECADGLRCQIGVCGTAGPAAADAPCARTSDCQDGLYCKSADGGSVCAPRALAGASCSNEFGSECQGACVKPDGGSPSCVAYCGSP